MMVAAEVQTGLERREHIIDGRLARIHAPVLTSRRRFLHDDERPGRLVRHQDVDSWKLLASFGFFTYEMPSFVVALLDRHACAAVWQFCSGCVEPRGCEGAAKPGDSQPSDVGSRAVLDVVQVCRLLCPGFPGGNAIEILVVALDPEQRTRRRRIRPGAAGEIADANPQRNVGMTFHRQRQCVEVPVDVSDRADRYPAMAGIFASDGGLTSRSLLSQMKSSLL